MSRRAAAVADTSAGLKSVAAIAFILVMTIVVLLLVNARPAPDPFDPRSGRPDGTRGLVVTLRDAGADVAIERDLADRSPDGRILLLDDRLDDAQRSELLDAVEAGAVALVADPDSSLHGGSGVDGGAEPVTGGRLNADQRLDAELEANLRPGDCTIEALDPLRGLVVADGLLFPVGPSEPRCFTGSGPEANPGAVTSFVLVRRIGAGVIIGLGDNELFQNRWLRGADNAALAVALLAPEPGAEVTVLLGRGANQTVDDVGAGDEQLRDLVPAWAWMAMVAGALAFVVFAASRATRLGRVLTEPAATPIDGNELVAATGNLMERAGHAPMAAWLVQHRLHRDLCLAHGVPLDAPLADLDRVVSARSTIAPGVVERVLRRTAAGDAELVEIVREVRRVRELVDLAAGSDPHTGQPPDGSPLSPTAPTPHTEVPSP